jgi:hypothetical protein
MNRVTAVFASSYGIARIVRRISPVSIVSGVIILSPFNRLKPISRTLFLRNVILNLGYRVLQAIRG